MSLNAGMPPQAFTKEMLTTAFEWLQTQPDSVRKAASSPDILMSLYWRSSRGYNGRSDAEAPVTAKHFVEELKGLAQNLKEFEEPKQAQSTPPQHTQYQQTTAAPRHEQGMNLNSSVGVNQGVAVNATPNVTVNVAINETAAKMIREVKSSFNLSSDFEAANMMVAIAYKNLKDLLA